MKKGSPGVRTALTHRYGLVVAALALLAVFAMLASPLRRAMPGGRVTVADIHHTTLVASAVQPRANAVGSLDPAGSHALLCCSASFCLQSVPALPAALVLPEPPPRAVAFDAAVSPTPPGVGGNPAVPPPRLLA